MTVENRIRLIPGLGFFFGGSMYSPGYAIEKDRKVIDQVIQENPFATIAYTLKSDQSPQCFHLPLILKNNMLIGHMARANQAWRDIDGEDVLIILHGPHCYISPEWYGTKNNVPTWNYISIHIRGKVSTSDDDEFLKEALIDLSRRADPQMNIEENISDHSKLLKSIVGISIQIESIFGKFKLAQSKPLAERKKLIKNLKISKIPECLRVAVAMERTLEPSKLKD